MFEESPRCEPAWAEDYFSDNTQGRKEKHYVQKSGATVGTVKAQLEKPKFTKRSSKLGQKVAHKFIRKISETEFNARLDQLNIPRPDDPIDMSPVIRDSAFSLVSEFLRQFGQGEWALRPRTFCILRVLGCPEAMDTFIAMKRTDAFLPYQDRNLPDVIKGADVRARFLELQNLVLSSQYLKELEEEGGAHHNFNVSADDYFSNIRPLGRGGFGIVDEVWGKFTLKKFARKRIHRGVSALKDEEALGIFEKELRALKQASHAHLVKLVSSYSDRKYVGLIMKPVADMNLMVYLRRPLESEIDRDTQNQCLRSFFGCLSKALEYLHLNRIIHKDIKPQNVLVKKEEVFLADFGTSRILGETSRSFSTGEAGARTQRYCAPEVADEAPRGKPSDIWSMGCVFLEMASVLCGHSLEEMATHYETNGSASRVFWKNEHATQEWIQQLRANTTSEDAEPLHWVGLMLQESQNDRPTASQVVANITDSPSNDHYFCFNCRESDQDNTITDAPANGNNTSSELVTEMMLHKYLQRDFTHHAGAENDADEDDTVTSKVLEDVGAVSVASDSVPPYAENSNSDSDDCEISINPIIVPPPELSENPNASVPESITTDTTGNLRHNMVDAGEREIVSANAPPSKIIDSTEQIAPHSSNLKSSSEESTQPEKRNIPPSNGVSFDRRDTPKNKVFTPSHRFSGLQDDQRPSPSSPMEESKSLDDTPVISPDPLKPPSLDRNSYYPLPRATLVPSYILAGANRFSMDEIRAINPSSGRFNLFVYGRFMFPSVLRAFAARSIPGAYSPLHQRRLIPTSSDWAYADTSIKRAAEVMTPARLIGFDAWRPSRMDCAAIEDATKTSMILANRDRRGYTSLHTPPPGEVTGFMILGVSEEALRYCDLVFCSDGDALRRGKPLSMEEGWSSQNSPLLRREKVFVEVQLASGQHRPVSAFTYLWSQNADQLYHPWRPESFIRGPNFQNLCEVEGSDWRTEETSLAETMKIGYALVGDELCNAILSDDVDKLQDLLENYDDVDARCRKYGTALQAAVAYGNEDMVQMLLEYGADPNIKGGRYGTPLIAGTIGKKREITRILLKNRADVFASHPQHVNALYQAVGSGDWALTEMLLEAGAWLSKDYGEIRDLAIERRDKDLQSLLLRYDVRDKSQYLIEDRDPSSLISSGESRAGSVNLSKYGSVTKAVVRKAFILSTQSGSWRGRKGVAVTRAALAAGAPPIIIDYIRNAMDPVQKLVDILKASDKQQEAERMDRLRDQGRVEEVSSDEDEDNTILKKNEGEVPKSPVINVSGPDERTDTRVSDRASPPASRRSSVSSIGSSHSRDVSEQRTRRKAVRFAGRPESPNHSPPTPRRGKDLSPRLVNDRPERSREPTRIVRDEPIHDPHHTNLRNGRITPRTRPPAPYVHIPQNSYPTSPAPSPSRISPASRYLHPDDVSRSPQLLAPPQSGRPRARSLQQPYSPPIVHQLPSTPRSSANALPMPQPEPPIRRSNSERANRPRPRDGNIARHEYHENPGPRRRSQPSERRECRGCYGFGWYIEKFSSQSGRDRKVEVDCRECGGRGWVAV